MSDIERIAIARIEEKLTQWMTSTDSYRVSLCDKMNKLQLTQNGMRDGMNNLNTKIVMLPCIAREVRTKAESRTQTLLWTGAWICFGAIFTLLTLHLGWK